MPVDPEALYSRGLISDAAMAQLRDTMTHQAEGPNPAQPYLDATTRFGTGVRDTLMAGPRLMGDVASGRVDPSSPEAIRRSADTALGLVGGGAFGAERGALGMAGGKVIGFPRKQGEIYFTDNMFLKHEAQYSKEEASLLNDAGNEVARAIGPIEDEEIRSQHRQTVLEALHNNFNPGTSREELVTKVMRRLGIGRGKDTDALQSTAHLPPWLRPDWDGKKR